jgi:hypothetical protein
MEDPSTGGMSDVVAGPGGLVAIGTVCTTAPGVCRPMAWTSKDGIAWERADGMPDLEGRLNGIAVTGQGLVAVGNGLVLTSPDGRTWTRQSIAEPVALSAVTVVGDRLFASTADGSGAVWASDDGTEWARVEPAGLTGIAGDTPAEWHFAATADRAVALGSASDSEALQARVSVRE